MNGSTQESGYSGATDYPNGASEGNESTPPFDQYEHSDIGAEVLHNEKLYEKIGKAAIRAIGHEPPSLTE